MTLVVGPLLAEIIKAQADDDVVLSYPEIGAYAEALVTVSRDLGDPFIWPIGPSAACLVGAATLVSRGGIRVWDGHSTLNGEAVLLTALNLVDAMPIESELRAARAVGAGRVHACGVSVPGLQDLSGLASFSVLGSSVSHRRTA